MHRRIPDRRVLLAPVLGVLLVLAGLLASENADPRARAVSDLSVAAGVAAPAAVSIPSSAPGVRSPGRPTSGPAVVDPGWRLAAFTAGRILPLVERAGAELHRTSAGPGDHLAVGPVAGVQPVSTAVPALPEGTAPTPPRVPSTAFGARAPPLL